VLINQFQLATNTTLIFHQEHLLVSGSVLAFNPDVAPLFAKAMKLVHTGQPF
jgi:hypothetical protein